jgi:hypothetical protein
MTNVNVGPGNLWTRACANRITAERLERDQHEKHLAALRHVKCSIDNRPPPVHTHLANKLKTKKLQEDRAQEIQLENRILLQKMLNIDTKASDLSGQRLSATRLKPRSLSAGLRRRELDRITHENRRMLNRLQAAAPSIDPMKWEQEEVERENLKARICQNANRYRRGPSLKMPRTTGAFQNSQMQGTTDWDRLADEELHRELEEFKSAAGPTLLPQ